MKLNNEQYDFLNSLVRYILPATGTFYVTLASIWNLPYAEQVAGTILAISTLLGLIIGLARRGWVPPQEVIDGSILIDDDDPDNSAFGLGDKKLEDFKDKDVIKLKVSRPYFHGDI